MTNLGFSLYPDNHELNTMIHYVEKLTKYDFTRVFMSLLQVDLENEELFAKYKQLIAFCRDAGLQVIVDVTPAIVEKLNQKGNLIDVLDDLGISGIRLDESLPIEQIVDLTQNAKGIKLELNMSTDASLMQALEVAGANMANLIGCHNFYPHAFTGLSREHFMKMSRIYQEKGIETAAFINAQTAAEGPWPVSEGLCTLEEHRHLPIESQLKMLVASKVSDNVIIANQFIEEEELERLFAVKREVTSFEIEPLVELTPNELQIIEYPHAYRGDVSEYMIRSTMTRVVFKEDSLEPRNGTQSVERGAVLIDNERYGRYKGELHIALRDFSVSDKVNVVGKLAADDLLYLDLLQPWERFDLRIKR